MILNEMSGCPDVGVSVFVGILLTKTQSGDWRLFCDPVSAYNSCLYLPDI